MVLCIIQGGVWRSINSIGGKGEEYDETRVCPWAASVVERVLTWESQICVLIQMPSLTSSVSSGQLLNVSAHIL